MTTVAWDGITLAADRLYTVGSAAFISTKVKKHGDLLLAFSGDVDQGEEMLDWIISGAKKADFPEKQRDHERFTRVLAITRDKNILAYECTPFPIRMPPQKYAMGSGRDFALAAMYLGQTAIQAVQLASLFDPGTGGGVDTLTHG